MKNKSIFNTLMQNDKVVLLASFVVALMIWVFVVMNVSQQTTRVLKDVKVNIDDAVPSQFGLEVFGEKDFTVDVTVKGKKYLISNKNLSAEDIKVTAITKKVDSVGEHTLSIKAEPVKGNGNFTIPSVSKKTIDVFFDTPKTVDVVIEPEIITKGIPIVKGGYTSGEINLSESSVTITGPSTEVSRVKKVVAKLIVEESLTSNKSIETELVPRDENNKSDFKYLSMNINKVVMTIPVMRVKYVDSIVTFKNAPDFYVVSPLKYSINPSKEYFNILVDEYDETNEYSVGTIDFRALSPSNNSFSFEAKNTSTANAYLDNFEVKVDMTGFDQSYVNIEKEKIKVNNPGNKKYTLTSVPNSVAIVGKEEDLKAITEDMITVEIDLSEVKNNKNKNVKVPAVVTVKSPNCWVYGNYMVDVSF